MRALTMVIGAAVVASAGGGADAQTTSPSGSQPKGNTATGQGLTPVDAMRADIGPLRTSTRQVQPDLRVPLNFDEVYRVPGSAGRERFARVSGALAAVFPRSQYDTGEKGVEVLVPAGTVFHIGGVSQPEARSSAPTSAARIARPVDLSADAQRVQAMVRAMGPGADASRRTDEGSGSVIIPAAAPLGPRAEERARELTGAGGGATQIAARKVEHVEPPGMLTSEEFRRMRVRDLLRAAARAERAGPERPVATAPERP